jgi:hypothetical protein
MAKRIAPLARIGGLRFASLVTAPGEAGPSYKRGALCREALMKATHFAISLSTMNSLPFVRLC